MGNPFNRESPFTGSGIGPQPVPPPTYAPNYSLQGQGAFAGAVSGQLNQAMSHLQAQMNAGLYQGYQPPTITERLKMALELQYYNNVTLLHVIDFGQLEPQLIQMKVAVLCGE